MSTTGAKPPQSAGSFSYSNWVDNDWTTPANIYGAGTASVTAATYDAGDQTYILQAYNFDFSAIPDGSIIKGITVVVNGYYATAPASIDFVQLLNDTTPIGDNKAGPNALGTGAADYTFGGVADGWNASLDAAAVKTSTFGVGIGCLAGGSGNNNVDVYIDSVTMTIEYEAPVTLTTNEARDLHAADSPQLSQVHNLPASECRSLHASDPFALTQQHTLIVNECRSLHAADSFQVSQTVQDTTLTVNECRSLHTGDSFALAQAHTLVVDECRHLHASDPVSMTEHKILVVLEAVHPHYGDSFILQQVHALAMNEAFHATLSESFALDEQAQLVELTVDEAFHSHFAETLTSLGPFFSWGIASPDPDEFVNPWTLWKHADGSAVVLSGDQWSSMRVDEPCFGPVLFLGTTVERTFQALPNKYESGVGSVVIYIRGSADVFAWDAATPSWTLYSGPVSGTWSYVQLKVEFE